MRRTERRCTFVCCRTELGRAETRDMRCKMGLSCPLRVLLRPRTGLPNLNAPCVPSSAAKTRSFAWPWWPSCTRPSADRGRAGGGQDHARPGPGPRPRIRVSAGAVHQRHAAERRARDHDLLGTPSRIRVQARAGVYQLPAGGRNQPHDAQDAIGAARSDERRVRSRSMATPTRCRNRFW